MKKAKKILISLLAFASVSAFTLGMVACGDNSTGTGNGNGGGIHKHVYDREIADEDYLKSAETCTAKATYYKSCECGARGTETFFYGDFGHVDNRDGTCAVCLQKYYSVGLEYELSDDETYYIVSGLGRCLDSYVVILSTHNNLPVKEMGEYAFRNCANLISVTLPDSITTICEYAFDDCERLISVNLGNSMTTIGNHAFADCKNLERIMIPDSVTTIGSWAFSNCNSLAYNLKGDLRYLGNDKNQYIYLVKADDEIARNINIDNTCRFIGDRAFESCSNLTSIAIPNSVTTIGGGAFSGCSSLTSITMPDSVTTIGNAAFRDCTSLTSVTIGNSVTTIGIWAFENCTSLTSVVFTDLSTWYKTKYQDDIENKANSTRVDVSDPIEAASLLKSTYLNSYYWYKL